MAHVSSVTNVSAISTSSNSLAYYTFIIKVGDPRGARLIEEMRKRGCQFVVLLTEGDEPVPGAMSTMWFSILREWADQTHYGYYAGVAGKASDGIIDNSLSLQIHGKEIFVLPNGDMLGSYAEYTEWLRA